MDKTHAHFFQMVNTYISIISLIKLPMESL